MTELCERNDISAANAVDYREVIVFGTGCASAGADLVIQTLQYLAAEDLTESAGGRGNRELGLGLALRSAEVRAQDIIDPDDINWYRQLAGGLTAANQLHGSANAIGGQNSVVKLRWGQPASAMRVAGLVSMLTGTLLLYLIR